MSSWIWSQSDLFRLAGHREAAVRKWAGERLCSLYGKEGREVLRKLLDDRDPEVLQAALLYLQEYPDPGFADSILKIYEEHSGPVAGRCASILGRFRDERLMSAYEEKKKANSGDLDEKIEVIQALGELGTDRAKRLLEGFLAGIREGSDPLLIEAILRSLFKAEESMDAPLAVYARFYQTLSGAILYPFTAACGSWHPPEELDKEEKKKLFGKSLPPAAAESLQYLSVKGLSSLAKVLEQGFLKKEYRRAIETCREWAEKKVSERGGKGEGIFQANRHLPPWINLRALRAFQKYSEGGPGDSLKVMAAAAMAILAKFAEFESLWGVKAEEVDREDLFSVLFEDRESAAVDGALIERILTEKEPGAVFDRCVRQLQDHPESSAADRVFRLMGKLKDPRAIPLLVARLADEENDGLSGRMGAPLGGGEHPRSRGDDPARGGEILGRTGQGRRAPQGFREYGGKKKKEGQAYLDIQVIRQRLGL